MCAVVKRSLGWVALVCLSAAAAQAQSDTAKPDAGQTPVKAATTAQGTSTGDPVLARVLRVWPAGRVDTL